MGEVPLYCRGSSSRPRLAVQVMVDSGIYNGIAKSFCSSSSSFPMAGLTPEPKSKTLNPKPDKQVMIDSGIYNGIAQSFCSVRLVFEFLPYGDVRPSFSIRVFKVRKPTRTGTRIKMIFSGELKTI